MDCTLQDDLFNNIKFNMHKKVIEEPVDNSTKLAEIFGVDEKEVSNYLNEFDNTLSKQSEKLKQENIEIHVESPVKIAFIGDSITSDRESYMNILKRALLAEKDIHIIDAAISGDKSDDAKMAFYTRVMKYNPDIVHILLGTNDMRKNNDPFGEPCVSLHDYRKNMEYMVRTLTAQGKKVILSTISPIDNEGLGKRFPEDNWIYDNGDLEEVNKIICETAEKYKALLNDMSSVYAQYQTGEILLQDGLHLNAAGQLMLAKNVMECIKKVIEMEETS